MAIPVLDVMHYMVYDPLEPADRQRIFCKGHHALERVSSLVPDRCQECPYFHGTELDNVIICQWKDVSESPTRVVRPSRREDEYYNISRLIGGGLLKLG